MFDVDNKDSTMGMSGPPAAFVEPLILQKVYNLLIPGGTDCLMLFFSTCKKLIVNVCIFRQCI